MPALKTYDVFISHAWSYHADYYRIQRFLNDAPRFRWRNYSVPEHNPLEQSSATPLEGQLRNQIRPVNVVIILAGMYVAYSDWIQFENDFAATINKPMIGVRPWGQQRTPVVVQNSVDEMGDWRIDSIVRAIRQRAI